MDNQYKNPGEDVKGKEKKIINVHWHFFQYKQNELDFEIRLHPAFSLNEMRALDSERSSALETDSSD